MDQINPIAETIRYEEPFSGACFDVSMLPASSAAKSAFEVQVCDAPSMRSASTVTRWCGCNPVTVMMAGWSTITFAGVACIACENASRAEETVTNTRQTMARR